MAERKTKQINVRLTPALYNRFQTALHRAGHTVTDALIALITQYCDETERKSGGARPSA